MLKFWNHHGILGINARNLLYIKPLNKKAQIQFADDKMRTKQYLAARGVSSARLLGKITSEAELQKFPWDSLPNDFVLKPNAGFGGEGIVVITNREHDGWITAKGDFFSQEEMIEHVTDTLEGRYSITGSPDTVFFEQRLICHPEMKTLGTFGLPDIRVIVYNMVPVMAMVRVPTSESHGKANIHMGGLGLGVDLSKGEITHMAHYGRIIKEHPDFGNLKGTKIPFWEEILLLATQIQQLVTLGYLAVDVVIDEDMGPALLEINARAGLAVQIANLAPLRDRLDRVAGVKVQTPEKGVRLAQDLFGNKIERGIQALSGKKVIGMSEEITLNLKHGTTTGKARMNPTMNKNYLEEKLFQKIAHKKNAEKLTLGYTLQGDRGKTVFYPLEMADETHQVILGKKVLSNFFLDVTRGTENKLIPKEDSSSGKARSLRLHTESDESYWHQNDNRLANFDRQLSLVSQLRPLNLAEEKKRFFEEEHYEPRFVYKPLPENLIQIRSELQALRIDLNKPIGRLFDEKRRELLQKADLIAVIGDDDHFPRQAELLMGLPPSHILAQAEKALKGLKRSEAHEDRTLPSDAVVTLMQSFLKEKGLHNWQVKTKEGIVSRCVVGKKNRLLVKADEMFSEEDVKKLIAHEIEVHVYCTENGKIQPFQVFRRGTAHYLKTQEGLAVFHQSRVVSEGYRGALLSFHAAQWAREEGFRAVFDRLCTYQTPDEAWKGAVKVKRGLLDAGQPGAFPKNALYYWGYLEVGDYIRGGGEWKDLFLGKFALSQVDLVRQIKGIRDPQYLPGGGAFS
ncbi:MAG: DUF1704 domain-containing protein [bacterium]|nr:DUF1704 domain-containing protein [bacterium]